MSHSLPRILIIAGSDSGGGAGIQADLKTVMALGGYAGTAITALTAQNTQGVDGILDVPPEFIRQQANMFLDDIGADAIKTGMLHNHAVIAVVSDLLAEHAFSGPLVVDPVLVAKGGARLLEPEAEAALKAELLPRATVLTPNIPEAEVLTGMEITSPDDMKRAAEALLEMGANAVLVKGGHLPGERLTDLLMDANGEHRYESTRIATPHTHGTGCTLASALATLLAQGHDLPQAVERARAYVRTAIREAPGLGKGHGPLAHANSYKNG